MRDFAPMLGMEPTRRRPVVMEYARRRDETVGVWSNSLNRRRMPRDPEETPREGRCGGGCMIHACKMCTEDTMMRLHGYTKEEAQRRVQRMCEEDQGGRYTIGA